MAVSSWPLAAARGFGALRSGRSAAASRLAIAPHHSPPPTWRGRRCCCRCRLASTTTTTAAWSLAADANADADADADADANIEADDDDWQQRSRLLFGARGLDALARTRVLVVGLGGVGSYAAEALARSGVGSLTIVDGDAVDGSNRNRQLLALRSTVGRPKAEVLAERLLDVNPRLRLTALRRFLDPAAAAALLRGPAGDDDDDDEGEDLGGGGGGNEEGRDGAAELAGRGSLSSSRSRGDSEEAKTSAPTTLPPPYYDYVIDCIDSLAPKVALIAAAARGGSRVVSSMGAGGRVDPSRARLVDPAHTQGDALGRAVRRGLRRAGVALKGDAEGEGGAGGWRGRSPPDGGGGQDQGRLPPPLLRPPPGQIVCVFSDEPARRASLVESRSAANPYKASFFGTASYVPAAFGLLAASAVVRRVADGASARDLLWVPPAAAAAEARAKKARRRERKVRRSEAAAAAGLGGAEGEARGRDAGEGGGAGTAATRGAGAGGGAAGGAPPLF